MIERVSNTNIFMFMGVLGVNGIIVSFRWVYDAYRSADCPGFYMWKGLGKQWCCLIQIVN
jgi:hypothetical protein